LGADVDTLLDNHKGGEVNNINIIEAIKKKT